MSDIDVKAYIAQLRATLPQVPPISTEDIKTLHRRGDLAGIVKLIRNTMNVNVRLTLHWTDTGRGTAPAWIEMPEEMPYYGTPAFARVEAHMFIMKPFAKKEPYNRFAMAVAHEFSHVVLHSLHRPLRHDEKAVDLTAMILGFSYLYRQGAHVVERAGLNRFRHRSQGYLTEREVDAACRILLPTRLRARHVFLDFLEACTGLLVYFAILGTIGISMWFMIANK